MFFGNKQPLCMFMCVFFDAQELKIEAVQFVVTSLNFKILFRELGSSVEFLLKMCAIGGILILLNALVQVNVQLT